MSVTAPSDVGDDAGDGGAEGVPPDLQHTAGDEEEEEEGAGHSDDAVHPYGAPAGR